MLKILSMKFQQTQEHSTAAPPGLEVPQTLHTAVERPHHGAGHHRGHQATLGVRTASPDADSAFGDGSSMLSNGSSTHRSRDSNVSSSADSSRGSLNTPSPTQVSHLSTFFKAVKLGLVWWLEMDLNA